jgi:hypothetical protein
VGPRAGLDAVKRKIPSPCGVSNPRPSSPQSSAIPLSYLGSGYYTDSRIKTVLGILYDSADVEETKSSNYSDL